jgi:Ca2+-binding EF-hand superfamily protein
MIDGGRLLRWTAVAACALVLGVAGEWRAVSGEPTAANDDVQDLLYLAPKRPIVIRLHLRVDGQPLAELHTAIARQLFETLDTDGNGLLEGKELAGIPPAEMLAAVAKRTGGQAARATQSMKPAPKDRATPDELAAYLLPFGINTFALAVDFGQKPVGDYSVAVPPDGYQRSVDMTSFLSVLDADGDGRVTVAECGRVDELFHKFDLNDDETISRTEIAEVASAKHSARKEWSDPLSDVLGLLQPVARSGPQLGLSRMLADQYHRMTKAQAATWLAESAPRFELDVALPKKSLQRPSVAVRHGAASVEKDGIALRTETAGEVILQLVRLPIELHASESPPRPVSRTAYAKAIFKRADRDNNDYLDASEFTMTNLGLGSDEFKAIDVDHNGMIFEDEWLAFMTLYEIVSDNRVTLTVAATATDPIAQFDSNGDGRLTHGEWVRALATIRSWDANHDGEISPDEVPRQFVGTFHLGTLRPTANRRAMNKMSPVTARPSSAPAWFQKMDRNRDGEVSFREFLGPLSVFRRLDANHDGYLDADEARSSKPQ